MSVMHMSMLMVLAMVCNTMLPSVEMIRVQDNLADSERPGDVYTAVLKLVIADIENEKDPMMLEVAEGLKGNVTRKVIK
jgi:DNA-directed RNA polymerase